jgi:threonine dehydratase
VPANKVEAIRALGARTEIYGSSQDEAFEKAAELQQQDGVILVHPFDDPDIIAGQGTIGLELIEDIPDLDAVLVPLSGGGLISGIALAVKTINPAIKVIGVSMSRGPVMYHSLQAGKPVVLAEEDTLADSLRGGIGIDNKYTFEIVKNYVDDVILVSEADIAAAMAFLFTEHRLVAEGAGVVGIAALMTGQVRTAGRNTAVIISGNNIQIPQFLKAVQPFLA